MNGYQNYDKVMIYDETQLEVTNMITIRPVSDLRNKFTDIESTVNSGEPVFLTKNGYGSMVVMSIDTYSRMNRNIEQSLDEADDYAEATTKRMTHEEVFGKLRGRVNG